MHLPSKREVFVFVESRHVAYVSTRGVPLLDDGNEGDVERRHSLDSRREWGQQVVGLVTLRYCAGGVYLGIYPESGLDERACHRGVPRIGECAFIHRSRDRKCRRRNHYRGNHRIRAVIDPHAHGGRRGIGPIRHREHPQNSRPVFHQGHPAAVCLDALRQIEPGDPEVQGPRARRSVGHRCRRASDRGYGHVLSGWRRAVGRATGCDHVLRGNRVRARRETSQRLRGYDASAVAVGSGDCHGCIAAGAEPVDSNAEIPGAGGIENRRIGGRSAHGNCLGSRNAGIGGGTDRYVASGNGVDARRKLGERLATGNRLVIPPGASHDQVGWGATRKAGHGYRKVSRAEAAGSLLASQSDSQQNCQQLLPRNRHVASWFQSVVTLRSAPQGTAVGAGLGSKKLAPEPKTVSISTAGYSAYTRRARTGTPGSSENV
jgi:hypothetical protein